MGSNRRRYASPGWGPFRRRHSQHGGGERSESGATWSVPQTGDAYLGRAQLFKGDELPPEQALSTDDLDEAAGRKATERLLTMDHDFTCIVTFNDLMAAGALDALRKQGFHVPQQISVATFGDTYARLTNPPLTTMAYPEARAGEQAVTALLDMLAGREVPPGVMLIPTELILRESTRVALRAAP